MARGWCNHTDAPGDPMFVADRAGVGAKQIFVDPAVGWHSHHQAWSPDGRWVYFAGGLQDTRQMDVWRIAAGGGQPERLTYHNASVGFPDADRRSKRSLHRAGSRRLGPLVVGRSTPTAEQRAASRTEPSSTCRLPPAPTVVVWCIGGQSKCQPVDRADLDHPARTGTRRRWRFRPCGRSRHGLPGDRCSTCPRRARVTACGVSRTARLLRS